MTANYEYKVGGSLGKNAPSYVAPGKLMMTCYSILAYLRRNQKVFRKRALKNINFKRITYDFG